MKKRRNYTLLTEIADAQRKDQELKAYFKKKCNNASKGHGYPAY
jgi:hypothetical protein